MRILKVVLVFFSIGFAIGSLEQAAGRAYPDGARPMTQRPLVADGTVPGLSEEAADLVTSVAYLAEEPLAVLPQRERGLRGPVFTQKRAVSEADSLPLSRVPVSKWMSRSGDPLAEEPAVAGETKPPEPVAQEFIMPFEAGRITSLFNQGRTHPAIDLAGPLGSRVQATTKRQKVIFAGWRGGYGNCVMAQDDLGRVHLYGHLRSISTRVGVMLDQGQMLGQLGSTGHSTGPHVHYEVRTRNGGHINPVTLLFPGRKMSTGFAWNGSRSIAKVAAAR